MMKSRTRKKNTYTHLHTLQSETKNIWLFIYAKHNFHNLDVLNSIHNSHAHQNHVLYLVRLTIKLSAIGCSHRKLAYALMQECAYLCVGMLACLW